MQLIHYILPWPKEILTKKGQRENPLKCCKENGVGGIKDKIEKEKKNVEYFSAVDRKVANKKSELILW